jgi:hypothetical protein
MDLKVTALLIAWGLHISPIVQNRRAAARNSSIMRPQLEGMTRNRPGKIAVNNSRVCGELNCFGPVQNGD